MVLPKWPLWAHLFYSVFTVLCFRRARVARAVLPPGALFRAGPLRFLPVLPNPTCAHSHIWGFPKPGHLKMAFFSARCRLDGAFPVEFP